MAKKQTYQTPEALLKKLRSGKFIIQTHVWFVPFIMGPGKNETIAKTAFEELKKEGYLKSIGGERYIFREKQTGQLTIFDI